MINSASLCHTPCVMQPPFHRCPLLFQYGANVSAVDHEGHNALWFARSAGSMECVELLRNQGCPDTPSLPRQRGSVASTGGNDVFDKLPASII